MLSRTFRFARNLTLFHKPWPLSTAVAERLDTTDLLEEENTPFWKQSHFHNTRLGDVLNGRYQVATKLGYGSYSTIWLVRDLRRLWFLKDRYLAVKIGASGGGIPSSVRESETKILQHITRRRSNHEGRLRVRKLVDFFHIDGVNDEEHICLVFEPLLEPLDIFKHRFVKGLLPPAVLRIFVHQILKGLDYLHRECNVVHADLKQDNLMLKLTDLSKLDEDARDEYADPLPQKHAGDGRVIYISRNNFRQGQGQTLTSGLLQITDFGHAKQCKGNKKHLGSAQAEVYRAPEVILDAGYSYPADIWSLGVMMWDLIEGRAIFDQPSTAQDEHDEILHLAQITALLGPVPEQFASGRRYSKFYGKDGGLKASSSDPGDCTFENNLTALEGEEKESFINFIKRMLVWSPGNRATAEELLQDPWVDMDQLK